MAAPQFIALLGRKSAGHREQLETLQVPFARSDSIQTAVEPIEEGANYVFELAGSHGPALGDKIKAVRANKDEIDLKSSKPDFENPNIMSYVGAFARFGSKEPTLALLKNSDDEALAAIVSSSEEVYDKWMLDYGIHQQEEVVFYLYTNEWTVKGPDAESNVSLERVNDPSTEVSGVGKPLFGDLSRTEKEAVAKWDPTLERVDHPFVALRNKQADRGIGGYEITVEVDADVPPSAQVLSDTDALFTGLV